MTHPYYIRQRENFDRELAGERGDYWKKEAERHLDRIRADFKSGQLIIESDGAGIWRSSGNYLPDECAYWAFVAGLPIDLDATEKKRDEQTERQLSEYRKNYKGPSQEELAEMRNAFGEGARVVNVLTGTVTQL